MHHNTYDLVKPCFVYLLGMCYVHFISGGIYPAGMIETYSNFPGEDWKKIFPLLNIFWPLCTFSLNIVASIGDHYGYDTAFYVIAFITMLSQIMLHAWRAKPKVCDDLLVLLNEVREEDIRKKV